MRTGRSIWTGRHTDRLVEVTVPGISRFGKVRGVLQVLVEPEHEAETRRFFDYAARFGRLFLALVLVSTAILLAGAFVSPRDFVAGQLLVALGLLALGGVVLVFPFATPETVAMVGLRRSIRLARAAGGATLVGALVQAVLAVTTAG